MHECENLEEILGVWITFRVKHAGSLAICV